MSPTLELRGAIVAALKGAAAVTALVSTRIFDPVPENATFPYIRISAADELQDDADCIPSVEVTQLIDVFSREAGSKQVMSIAAAVRDALHRASMTLSTNALVEIYHRQTRFQDDPTGEKHAIVEVVATIENN